MNREKVTMVLAAAFAGLALLWPVSVGAETKAKTKTKRPLKTFGLGIIANLDGPLDDVNVPSPNILLLAPLQLSDSFRLEPELGFASLSAESSNSENDAKSTLDTLSIRGGLGLLYTHRVLSKSLLIGGVRLGGLSISREAKITLGNGENLKAKQTQSATYAALVTGGEFFFSPSVSLGGEFQLLFLSTGEVEESGDDVEDNVAESGLFVVTTGMLTLRWYFL